MSEWADFCEDMGVDPGSPEDYDRLIDHISGKPLARRPSDSPDDNDYAPADKRQLERQALRFDSREQAEKWSRRNHGRKVVPSIHGPHFVPEDGVDAPLHKGAFAESGVTIWPPKPYPLENPLAPTWIPGTYPTTEHEAQLHFIDGENDRRRFFPRLRKLSVSIYRASLKSDVRSLPKQLCHVYGRQMTEQQMLQLLGLAEDRIERYERYFCTETQAYQRPPDQRQEPDHWAYIRIDGNEHLLTRPRPTNLVFWQVVYEEVMAELVELI